MWPGKYVCTLHSNHGGMSSSRTPQPSWDGSTTFPPTEINPDDACKNQPKTQNIILIGSTAITSRIQDSVGSNPE